MSTIKNEIFRNKLETNKRTDDISAYASPSRIKSREAETKALRDAIAELRGDYRSKESNNEELDLTSYDSNPVTLEQEHKITTSKEPIRIFLDKVMEVERSLRNYLFEVGKEIYQLSDHILNDLKRIIK